MNLFLNIYLCYNYGPKTMLRDFSYDASRGGQLLPTI